jgi:hypothetical protein
MSFSILVHDDVSPGSQAQLLRILVDSAPRGTVVIRTNNGESVTMRHPTIGGNAGGVFLAYKHDIVYANDIEFVEAYDPNPNFNPEGV